MYAAPDLPCLVHPSLDDGTGGAPLDEARLTGQHRLALVFQGAALLVHLRQAGLVLPGGWAGARAAEGGRLLAGRAKRGRLAKLEQAELLGLVRRLFRTDGPIVGRGEARRAARYLVGRWQQTLAPSSPDRTVAEILEAAPFLWLPAFAEARTALVAEYRTEEGSQLWIAGPGGARRRLLARGGDRRGVEELLAGDEAADVWEGFTAGADPQQLAAAGRHRAAVASWRRQPPRERRAAYDYARSLCALGRYSQALEALKGRSHFEARLLRIRCQLSLGQYNAVQRALDGFEPSELSGEHLLDLAEVATHVSFLRGQPDSAQSWMTEVFQHRIRGRRLRCRVELLSAEAAWDRHDYETMSEHLEASREALEDPVLARRWHHVRGLLALGVRDGAAATEHVTEVLRGRRHLRREEAGRLWSDLAVGRTLVGDLAGAERACWHALRLLTTCDGPLHKTLALYNLAEVRLRRGRLEGVIEALEVSTEENRRAGNVPGLVNDLALWVRLELARGRAEAALTRVTEAVRYLEAQGLGTEGEIFDLLSARAHGWLGQAQAAALCLERAPSELLLELEPEERPAVWALAGRADRAADQAAGTPWEPFWSAHVAGFDPDPGFWAVPGSLESFRAARLVFDGELVRPGSAPPEWVRRAIATFRRVGADGFAEKLETTSKSPWRALERYLDHREIAAEHAVSLFGAAGYRDLRLTFVRGGKEEVLLAGKGGACELVAALGGGNLILRSAVEDSVLRCLFALVRRDLGAPSPDRERDRREAAAGGILGESERLKEALVRLDRLAASSDLPVLILGESGTGKELAAHRAHAVSRRSGAPFLAMNCAALSENLIESELFGHVRGAFTGAERDRAGVFEAARGGTVLLDEIGDLPQTAQGKLLRVLQEKEVRRVGESFARKVDVRVMAATHRDLLAMVESGEFRQDLFFRLKGATIRLPPLRERGNDVVLLAEHCLRRRAQGKEPLKLSSEVRAHLLRHEWPGNVRELMNVLEVAAALATGREIQLADLDLPAVASFEPAGDYHQLMGNYRKKILLEALAASKGNQALAARRLGLTRQALSHLVRQLELS